MNEHITKENRNSAETKLFCVDTPIGTLCIRAKEGNDEKYPGVYVDHIRENGELVPVSCTEYDPAEDAFCTDVMRVSDGTGENRIRHAGVSSLEGIELAKKLINDFCMKEYDAPADFSKLDHIPVAHTTVVGFEELQIQSVVDLKNFCFYTYIITGDHEPWVRVNCVCYQNCLEMIHAYFGPYSLDSLDFGELVQITWSMWEAFARSHAGRKWLTAKYPPGCRVKLVEMPDDPFPVPVGTCGTVAFIDDAGQIHVCWDTGSSLAVLFGVDSIEILEG